MSTAYYALFHLLISEATENWARPELRAILGRCFDHGTRLTASEKRVSQVNSALKGQLLEGADKTVAMHLRTVASAFIQAQQSRNDADYNVAKEWAPVEVAALIAVVSDAFKTWNTIRGEAVAQAYLVSLLGPKERRANEAKLPLDRGQRRQKGRDSSAPPTPQR